jgi:hypothetical protein
MVAADAAASAELPSKTPDITFAAAAVHARGPMTGDPARLQRALTLFASRAMRRRMPSATLPQAETEPDTSIARTRERACLPGTAALPPHPAPEPCYGPGSYEVTCSGDAAGVAAARCSQERLLEAHREERSPKCLQVCGSLISSC